MSFFLLLDISYADRRKSRLVLSHPVPFNSTRSNSIVSYSTLSRPSSRSYNSSYPLSLRPISSRTVTFRTARPDPSTSPFIEPYFLSSPSRHIQPRTINSSSVLLLNPIPFYCGRESVGIIGIGQDGTKWDGSGQEGILQERAGRDGVRDEGGRGNSGGTIREGMRKDRTRRDRTKRDRTRRDRTGDDGTG